MTPGQVLRHIRLPLSDSRMILSGALPAAVLALGVDGVLAVVERVVKPGGGG